MTRPSRLSIWLSIALISGLAACASEPPTSQEPVATPALQPAQTAQVTPETRAEAQPSLGADYAVAPRGKLQQALRMAAPAIAPMPPRPSTG
ncbi:MAG: hypothetical protein ABF271_12465, partial [Abyssibacter sp.]